MEEKSNVTNENYYNESNNKKYMSASQFKDFLKCPSCAIAKINGEYKEENTKALMMGSYIDAYFSGEMEQFKKNNSEIYNAKTGELKSDYKQCEDIINFIKEDEMLMKYLSGEHQVIITGEIAGVPFRGKIDSYFPNKLIVDQKIMKDLEPIWDEDAHCKKNVVDYWGYAIQGAIYRELVRQKTGKTLPFVLAITTKEKVPNKALLRIDDDELDKALELVKEKAPIFQKMKLGETTPTRCGKCDYCKSTYKVLGVKSFHEIDPYKENFDY